MNELLGALLALLFIMMLGAGMQKRLALPESFFQSANTLVIRVTLPALTLASMNKEFSIEMATNSFWLVVTAACMYGALIIGLEIWRKVSKLPTNRLGVYQYLILVGNTAFMGYPVIRAIYGSDGIFYASVFNLVHNFVVFSYALGLFQRGSVKLNWGKLLSNACLMATLAGIVLFLTPLSLPAPVHQALAYVGDITIPLCLLCVGARLARSPLRSLIRPAAVWWVSLTRLVLFPCITIPVFTLLGLSGVRQVIPIVMFATPVALTAASFAEQYGGDADFAGKVVLLSNLTASVSMPIVVLLLQLIG